MDQNTPIPSFIDGLIPRIKEVLMQCINDTNSFEEVTRMALFVEKARSKRDDFKKRLYHQRLRSYIIEVGKELCLIFWAKNCLCFSFLILNVVLSYHVTQSKDH